MIVEHSRTNFASKILAVGRSQCRLSSPQWVAVSGICVLSLLTSFSGCSTPQPIQLEGRWAEQRTDAVLEFTPSGLCAEVNKYPREVLCFRFRLDQDKLDLAPLTVGWPRLTADRKLKLAPAAARHYKVQMALNRLVLEKDGVVRKFDRLQDPQKTTPETGLWTHVSDSHHQDLYEFTPSGTMVSVFWNRLDPPYGDKLGLISQGQWHRYKVQGDQLEFDGFSPVQALTRCKAKFTYNGPDQMTVKVRGAKLELTRLKELPKLEIRK